MDRNLRNFMASAAFLIFVFTIAVLLLGYLYIYSTITLYNAILLSIIILLAGIAIFFTLAMTTAYFVYRKRKLNAGFLWVIRLILNVFMPAIIYLTGILKMDKDSLRSFYISLNNLLVDSGKLKYEPNQILILLPHCLQFSGCSRKITGDTQNCAHCGNCCIGDIIKVANGLHVNIEVVTGGTAARSIVTRIKPKLVLSVACERDLVSGISDVRNIPVIGIINERPNGPCYNTNVDASLVKDKLMGVLK